MALIDLNTIKNWFRTDEVPTQSQFWDVFDSFWHKSTVIPTTSVDGLDGQLANKVDKIAGKELSDENYTTTEKAQLAGIDTQLDTKVDKVVGKDLSDENYSLAEKLKLAGLETVSLKFVDGIDPLDAVYMDGNVGIKTLTPARELEINGDAEVRKKLYLGRDEYGSPTDSFLNIGQRVFDNAPTNIVRGDIYQKFGNLYYSPAGGASIPKSLTGMGLDKSYDIQGALDLNTLVNASYFGVASLVKLGYTYGQTLVEKGCTNVHTDAFSGAVLNFNGDDYYKPQVQVLFDNKGQLFIRGIGSYSNTRWQKYISEGIWRNITLVNGWTNFDSVNNHIAQFKVEGKTITLRGNIKDGLQNQVVGVISERPYAYGYTEHGENYKTTPLKPTRHRVVDDLSGATVEIRIQEVVDTIAADPSTANGQVKGMIYKVGTVNKLLLEDDTAITVNGRTKIVVLTASNTNVELNIKYDID